MKKTWCLLWTPKYFRRQLNVSNKKKLQSGATHPEANVVKPRAKSPKKAQVSSKLIVPSTYYIHPHMNTEARAAEPALTLPKNNVFYELTTKAEGLLNRFAASGTSSPSTGNSPPDVHAALVFEAKRDILGPLGSFLPSPSTVSSRRQQAFGSGKRRPLGERHKLKVVPDAALETPVDYLEHAQSSPADRDSPTIPTSQAATTRSGAPSSMSKRQPAQLSLEQVVTLLRLYDLAASEDGLLLQQLFDELHRFFFVNMKQAKTLTSSPMQENGKQLFVKLPLSPLLFMLSELGLVEEALLQHLTTIARDDTDSTQKSILLSQLPSMEERELLLLLVALHRFGLQNEEAFGLCVKRLRRLQWHSKPMAHNSSSSTAAYWKFLVKVEKQQNARPQRVTVKTSDGNQSSKNTISDTENDDTLLESLAVVPMPPPLGLPVALLLEVLTALALSLHRRQDVVQMVVRLLVANVGHQFANIASEQLSVASSGTVRRDASPSVEEHEMLSILAQQVKRAIELCESMMYPQLILVELFAELREAAATGVLADGGELAAIPSDRIVYYDHVTADLVKLRHVTS